MFDFTKIYKNIPINTPNIIFMGGTELNFHYGESEPSDKNKVWLKCNKPTFTTISSNRNHQNIVFSKELNYLTSVLSKFSMVQIDDDIYILGGIDLSGSVVDTIYKYNISTNTLTLLEQKLATPFCNMMCVNINKKIYIMGGWNGKNGISGANTGYMGNKIYIFDTTENTLTQCSYNLNAYKSGCCCCADNDEIYLFGGFSGVSQNYTNASLSNNITLINTRTGAITTKSVNLANPDFLSSAIKIDNNVYIVGGYNSSNLIQHYDINTNIITTLDITLPESIGGAHMCTNNGNILYYVSNQKLIAVDLSSKTSEVIYNLPYDLTYGALFYNNLANEIFLFGGTNLDLISKFSLGNELKENQLYILLGTSKKINMIKNSSMVAPVTIDNIYIGNSENNAIPVEILVYDTSTEVWNTI